ncbi:MAG TPA: hypothetical protein VFG59_10530 [Anaeromyxobacter sp.]|nr:hypothetical protein [Anaeromyxobacter sp.]
MIPAPAITAVRGTWTAGRLLALALGATVLLAALDTWAFACGAEGVRLGLEFVAYAVASAVAWQAARAFGRGDHLRGAWCLLSLSCLFIGSLALFPTRLLEGSEADPAIRWAASLDTVVANACGVVGLVLFALTWRRAGLVLPGRAWQKAIAGCLLLAVALAAVGPDIREMWGQAVKGDVWSAAALVADVCDLVLGLLLVPVFLTARGLAGGPLVWPFGFLAAYQLAWMVFDGFQTYKWLLGLAPLAAKFVSAFLHRFAAMLIIAGAAAQLLALRRARTAGPGP